MHARLQHAPRAPVRGRMHWRRRSLLPGSGSGGAHAPRLLAQLLRQAPRHAVRAGVPLALLPQVLRRTRARNRGPTSGGTRPGTDKQRAAGAWQRMRRQTPRRGANSGSVGSPLCPAHLWQAAVCSAVLEQLPERRRHAELEPAVAGAGLAAVVAAGAAAARRVGPAGRGLCRRGLRHQHQGINDFQGLNAILARIEALEWTGVI